MESGSKLKTSIQEIAPLQPLNDQEFVSRALFYAHSLEAFCRKQVERLVQEGTAGVLGLPLKNVCDAGISDWNIGNAVKELTCISVHLVGLDLVSEGEPAWLMQYLFETLKETDELFPAPTAQEVISKHGSWKRERMLTDVANSVSKSLGFGMNEKVLQTLQTFLSSAAPYRAELLVLSLTQPHDVLREHLNRFA